MQQPDSIMAEPGQSGPNRALILAGGGVRVAYQAGVLQALAEGSLKFNHVDGTSGGIFNTAMLASGLGPEEIMYRWKNLKLRHFMSGRPAKEYLRLGRLPAFGDADQIRAKVFPALGIDLAKINRNREISATFNVCNFSVKTVEAIPHQVVQEDHLIAGMSLPIFMPALQIKGDWYSDAVWIKDANLMEAVRRGAEEVWLVWAIGNTRTYQGGSFNQYVHMIEMSANGGLLEEFAQINLVNQLILLGESPYGQTRPIRLHVIKPTFPLPLDPDLFLGKIDTTTLINWGYVDGKKYLTSLPSGGVAFGPAATQMREPGPTLSFRSRFTGTLDFGQERSPVAFDLAFRIQNQDQGPELLFTGSIQVEGWGRELPTHHNRARVQSTFSGKSIFLSAALELAGSSYALRAELPLHSPLYWLLGLDLKEIYLEILPSGTATPQLMAEGVLHQSIRHRFQGVGQSSLRHWAGPGNRHRAKYRLLSQLYRMEQQEKEAPELVNP